MGSRACVRAVIPPTSGALSIRRFAVSAVWSDAPAVDTQLLHHCNFAATYSSILALLPMSAGESGPHHGEHVMLALGTIARVAHAIEIAPIMSM